MIGSLSKGVFERRTSTEIKAFHRLIWLDATTFVLPCFVTLIPTICRKGLAKPLPKNEKSPLPVDLRPSKTSLLELLMKGLSEGFLLPSQWRTQGRGPRGRPHYFQTKLKKNFRRPPPPPLSQSLNDRTSPPHPLSQGLNSALCRVDGRRGDSVSYPDLCEWGHSDLIYIWTYSFESPELRQRLRLELSVEIMWTSGLTQILWRSSLSYGDVLLHTVDDKIPLYFWVGVVLRFLECSKGRN